MASGGGSGGSGFLNLERHFTFYGAYHSNPVNVFIHTLFIWPIFLTALLLLHLTAPFPRAAAVFTAVYGAFYASLDRRSGSLVTVLCRLFWGARSARLGFSLGWPLLASSFD
ncbi:2-hydroxy-palmitic acid dioxygenase mpo1-like [Hordeum vulgare subsp. vulgare]|uniref:2-hydroxy-palmitic acid dioxygenase mpo1-like n=1 Tax=Hordeum vulgare subsp. vulgare TaxID=112509 RepID=UPI000B460805|nr:2-hydroxy-palmitic acid dioxygenase mpo1-like [Hordeum vulgare subsp. vulgare]